MRMQEYVSVRDGDRAPVCGSRTYTVIEDRPIEKERRTTVLEHHTWEKTFVIETRLVGERELQDQAKVRGEETCSAEPNLGVTSLVCDRAPEASYGAGPSWFCSRLPRQISLRSGASLGMQEGHIVS